MTDTKPSTGQSQLGCPGCSSSEINVRSPIAGNAIFLVVRLVLTGALYIGILWFFPVVREWTGSARALLFAFCVAASYGYFPSLPRTCHCRACGRTWTLGPDATAQPQSPTSSRVSAQADHASSPTANEER